MSHSRALHPLQCPFRHAKLLLPSGSQTLATFIDYGVNVNLIDEDLAQQLGINRVPLSKALSTSDLEGHLLGMFTHLMEPIHLLLSGNHHETIQCHILHFPHLPRSWGTRGCGDTIRMLTGSRQ